MVLLLLLLLSLYVQSVCARNLRIADGFAILSDFKWQIAGVTEQARPHYSEPGENMQPAQDSRASIDGKYKEVLYQASGSGRLLFETCVSQ
jgi:hypothetical protein